MPRNISAENARRMRLGIDLGRKADAWSPQMIGRFASGIPHPVTRAAFIATVFPGTRPEGRR